MAAWRLDVIEVLHHIPADGQAAFFAAGHIGAVRGRDFSYKDVCGHPWRKRQANRLHNLADCLSTDLEIAERSWSTEISSGIATGMNCA